MMSVKILVTLVCSLTSWNQVWSLGGSEQMYDLHEKLFKKYNKMVRPCLNYSFPTEVSIQVHVTNIMGMDVKNQMLKLIGMIFFEWTDELLTWNPGNHGQIEAILVDEGLIWKPLIVVVNAMSDNIYLGDEGQQVKVHHDGHVMWRPVLNMELSCDVDVSKFPFDKHTCGPMISSWMNDNATVKMISMEDPIVIRDVLVNGQFWVEPGGVDEDDHAEGDKHYKVLNYKLQLSRRPTYMVMTLVLPVTLIAMLAGVSFLMSPDEPEKLSMSITVLLSFTVFLGIIDDDLPETSQNVSLLVIYLVALLLLSFFCVIANGIVYLAHRQTSAHNWSSRGHCLSTQAKAEVGPPHTTLDDLKMVDTLLFQLLQNEVTPRDRYKTEPAVSMLSCDRCKTRPAVSTLPCDMCKTGPAVSMLSCDRCKTRLAVSMLSCDRCKTRPAVIHELLERRQAHHMRCCSDDQESSAYDALAHKLNACFMVLTVAAFLGIFVILSLLVMYQ